MSELSVKHLLGIKYINKDDINLIKENLTELEQQGFGKRKRKQKQLKESLLRVDQFMVW